jgi:tRNA(His) 5'-end guanylyltransferase
MTLRSVNRSSSCVFQNSVILVSRKNNLTTHVTILSNKMHLAQDKNQLAKRYNWTSEVWSEFIQTLLFFYTKSKLWECICVFECSLIFRGKINHIASILACFFLEMRKRTWQDQNSKSGMSSIPSRAVFLALNLSAIEERCQNRSCLFVS